MIRRLTPLALATVLLPLTSLAQQQQQTPDANSSAQPTLVVAQPPPPATNLEKLLTLKNVVIVKGFTEIATVNGEDGASLRVIAVELTTPQQQDRAYGLAIEVHNNDRTAISYVDADEIDGLITGIDYLTRAEASVTQLANYMVQYRTKGEMELSNFAADGARLIGVKSTQILPTTNQLLVATAYFRVAAMGELRQQIIAGQQAIEKIKGAGR